MGITASADKPSWNAVGDAVTDEAARGEGKQGAAAADETTVRLKGDVSSVNEASRTTVWRTITDEATAKRGSVGRRFRRNHRTAAVVIDSAEKSVLTAVEDVVADEATGRRESGTGDRRRERGRRTAAGCVASPDNASSTRGRGAETCHRYSQGWLWASHRGRSRGAGGEG